ncbi:hypothetical protein Leryth_008447 [Lithospermum erythrorhizon]|nr:hypothetical protein Leryth_008447 [Lithospermum erythrorhizon]
MGSAALYYSLCEDNSQQPHFLDACSLCQRSLSHNSDIFMYRGNTPFCSQECRQEQIEIDEASEKRWKVSSKRSSSTNNNKHMNKSSESTNKSDTNESVRTSSSVEVA